MGAVVYKSALLIAAQLFRHLPKLQECLQSNDVHYRIAVGETIALLVELGRDVDEVGGSQTVEAAAQAHAQGM